MAAAKLNAVIHLVKPFKITSETNLHNMHHILFANTDALSAHAQSLMGKRSATREECECFSAKEVLHFRLSRVFSVVSIVVIEY